MYKPPATMCNQEIPDHAAKATLVEVQHTERSKLDLAEDALQKFPKSLKKRHLPNSAVSAQKTD
jgi:hypothetical protein